MNKELFLLLSGATCWILASNMGYSMPAFSGIEELIFFYLVGFSICTLIRKPFPVRAKAKPIKERVFLLAGCGFLGLGLGEMVSVADIREVVCSGYVQISAVLFYLNHAVRVHLARPVQAAQKAPVEHQSRSTL